MTPEQARLIGITEAILALELNATEAEEAGFNRLVSDVQIVAAKFLRDRFFNQRERINWDDS